MTGPAGQPPGDGDLDTRAKIHDVVVAFYREVVFDDLLAPVFGEVAEVDWSQHIPRLIDYWCRVLLGEVGYDGHVLGPHRHVHELEPLRPELFDRWFVLWAASVDSRWAGPGADRAKSHAARIAGALSRQILGDPWSPPRERAAGAPDDAVGARWSPHRP